MNNNHIATIANQTSYNLHLTQDYIDGAPHIKHEILQKLYFSLLIEVFNNAKVHNKIPTVLDLGAGEGSVTLPFLELGAKVTAIDISSNQLDSLKNKCIKYQGMLETRCEDINDTLNRHDTSYDIIVMNSFLHHIPDYLSIIKSATILLNDNGQLFTFQDPLRYESLRKKDLIFSNLSYFSWRIFKGDIIRGAIRKIRRSKGVYLETSIHDNTEYHVVRNGIDQDSIHNILTKLDFLCQIIPYFSTQNSFFQTLGTKLNIINTFALIATKKS